MGEESLILQSKSHLGATFPPLAVRQALGKVLGMRDDNDFTPDDGDDTPDDGDDTLDDGGDHDQEPGSFDEDQYALDNADQDDRRGSCLLVLLAVPAAGLLALLW
ncbi:MAG: hypothetical protein CK522_03485 [Opitutia bacterium]|nr:MAG: hypothetical protein CK522_03485 [Opitutae bacterium]